MSKKPRFIGGSDLKVAVIGDEDTVVGFCLAGVGGRDAQGRSNFLIVDNKTRMSDIENAFREFCDRKDIGVILINQHIAEQIRYMVDTHEKVIPTVLEIPSKDKPYDASKDSVMSRVKVFFGGNIE
ncbi:unnamed protein product [Vitrella brassicaformis CCMP3155]|uniref:V-type proton ATPase subunit F n=1 Tax=Vitrella brassicaformis (strain CCMP3155) TaxID=1169540 RepID=A0A0G4FE00_VITBC|nr:unnamed protein product [Vitrella brassicaformis CCMP3155]|mmetsp:Transcript_20323/g.49402  ORF Transcript_20323/g.49402 Transcript_20323/m.49402 type:complete len:126 (-) Transcript_20323:292-669(-)|eukprot:CEM11428.1 unnamed protein product [Vitrella brassicaformis CCMP3155]